MPILNVAVTQAEVSLKDTKYNLEVNVAIKDVPVGILLDLYKVVFKGSNPSKKICVAKEVYLPNESSVLDWFYKATRRTSGRYGKFLDIVSSTKLVVDEDLFNHL